MIQQTLIPAVAYIRMSSSQQEASPDQQRAEVAKLAKKYKCQILREYFDEAVSGAETRKRKDFRRMIADAENGDFRVILCWDQDRFGRFDSIEAGEFVMPLRRAGVRLITVAQGEIDWESVAGQIIFSVTQMSKNQFLVDLSRNVLRGHLASASRGDWSGAPPMGYDRMYFDETGQPARRVPHGQPFRAPSQWRCRLVVSENPRDVEIVRFIFAQFTTLDCSLRSIAVALNSSGSRTAFGAKWNTRAVRRVLRNPAYVGDTYYGRRGQGKFHRVGEGGEIAKVTDRHAGRQPRAGEGHTVVVRETHEAIVPRAMFDAVQLKLGTRNGKAARSDGSRYLLSGILRCGHCGSLMHGQRGPGKGRRNGRRVYDNDRYVCRGYSYEGPATCQCRGIPRTRIEGYVLNLLRDELLKPETLESLRRELLAEADARCDRGDDTTRLRATLAALDRKIKKATEHLLELEGAAFRQAKAVIDEWHRERHALGRQLKTALKPRKDSPAAMAEAAVLQLDSFREALEQGDPRRVRETLKGLIERVDLWWVKVPSSRWETQHRFSRGQITFREGVFVPQLSANAGVSGTACAICGHEDVCTCSATRPRSPRRSPSAPVAIPRASTCR